MNWLSLRLDQKKKIKLTRWWNYHASDDIGFFAMSIAIFALGVVIYMAYGLFPR